MGVDLGGWSFGAQFGDLDNDGHLDLYLANGYVSASKAANYWYDYSKVAGGHELVISDAKNWPAMGDRSLAGYQQKRVWRNDGAGHFVDVAQMVGASDHHDGRAVALADLGDRGALDVLVANQRGPLLLYRNQVAPGRDWIAFDLEGACRGRRAARRMHQPQRDRRARHRATGRADGRCRRSRAAPASARRTSGGCTSASGRVGRDREGRRPLALGKDAGAGRRPRSNRVHAGQGARVTTPAPPRRRPALAIDNRYLAPILVTLVLIMGQVTFGFLESWSRTFLAIGTSIAVELLLGRLLGGAWPHLASSYISGISIGMLIRSPEFWPYALCAAISITSKYVLRVDGRHLWNPSNFGIVAMLVLASNVVASLSVQWGNTLLPMVVVWLFGSRDHLPPGPVPHHAHLRRVLHRVLARCARR